MRHLRFFLFGLLVSITVAGCRHRQPQVEPPPQQQAPIVTTLPPIPPLTFPDVQLAKPEPAPAPVPAETPPPPAKPKVRHTRHHLHHPGTAAEETAKPSDKAPATASSATSVLGNLSADDAGVSPSQSERTLRLIHTCQERLNHLSHNQQIRNAQAIGQIRTYLKQAQQAMSTNDTAGGETLAMKAKILLDEINR
jgi:outer membrane biosynthesis protein TonB